MKKIIGILTILILVISCKTKGQNKDTTEKSDEVGILKRSVGSTNMILTVIDEGLWNNNVGNEIRKVFGEHQVGLPQAETLVDMTQIDPTGFSKVMNGNKAIMVVKIGAEESVKIKYNEDAAPQVVVYVTAKSEEDLIKLINKKGKEIILIFKKEDIKHSQNVFSKNKLKESKFETIKDLNISLTIPTSYNIVKDSIGFLWLRQHLKSGIVRGSNNILIYSLPLENEETIADSIPNMRNKIGKKHIPGEKEDMYMITEEAYTPHIFEVNIAGRKAYETRGKWEVKGDFMAGPFINYTIIDKPKNRIIVFEGFTFAPSARKRNFIFELEAIAKSIKIN